MAVLIPEVLQSLPEYAFVTSSIDALIHGSESYLSPGATPASELFSLEAIRLILNGYEKIYFSGGDPAEQRKAYLKDFCCGANYAGIAFGNAGCAAVHAISYAIGGAFHVAHGEANYQFFTEVFKLYQKKAPEGKIRLFKPSLRRDPGLRGKSGLCSAGRAAVTGSCRENHCVSME